MRWEEVLLVIFSLFFIVILAVYWFVPMGRVEFGVNTNSNFSLSNNSVKMQFYDNMRFPHENLSYSIEEGCTLKKRSDMVSAFEIIRDKTILDFYPVDGGEDIFISCQNKNKVEDGMFIAGEGGPDKVVRGENFQVILHGEILLIKDSVCPRPNVAVHELLHVLGFDHSDNENNIMYPVSKCKQTIGEEIINKINKLYSIEPLSDLRFEEVSAVLDGRTLDVNASIRNDGLKNSGPAYLVIYANNDEIKRVDIENMSLGYGVKIELRNLLVVKFSIDQLKLVIETDELELSKENNEVLLTSKEIKG
jgi:hypothetical protein